MAAKPPKPPGNFLKQLNDCLSNNPKNNNNTKNLNKVNVPNLNKLGKDKNSNGNEPSVSCTDIDKTIENCVNVENNANEEPSSSSTSTSTVITSTSTSTSKINCNCTNISIMHLFHEMKQEFPTIPDTIVAQCVNDNCHQRENCIQQLRNELALNPIPVQSYPAKVLHPLTQRQQIVVPKIPFNCNKPLKPIRPAPVQPPNITIKQANRNKQGQQSGLQFPINLPQQRVNCDSISSVTNLNNNNCINNPIEESHQCNHNNIVDKDVEINIGECAKIENIIIPNKTSDMPSTTSQLSTSVANCECDSVTRLNNPLTENRENVNPNRILSQQNNTVPFQQPPFTPRTRPNTLNLQTHDQQQQRQQRQQINIQLQKHFQQRNQQQQQQQSSQPQAKPLRKAPLPPIPPKPIQSNSSTVHSPQFHRSINIGNSKTNQYNNCNKSINNNNNNNSNNNNNYNFNNYGLKKSQQSSVSNESSLTSPTGSVGGESEISVNVSLSSPICSSQQALPLTPKSPRHRSVITVNPEPPYTKDFINSPSSSSSTTTPSNATSPKSFTSVNLTLRPPNINSSIPASTIDISAGPGLSGNSSGLTYSSTSYNARQGYQKNFHITVTDQGGVFSASHIRPHSCHYADEREYEQDGANSPTTGNNINPLRTATSEQCVAQQHQQDNSQLLQKQQQQQQQQQKQHNQQQQLHHIVASDKNEMCVPQVHDVLKDTLERQKSRRDKLATALRDNKKRLNQVAHEINVLIEPISPEETERLDNEIQKLRCDCEFMLNEIDVARRLIPSLSNINNESWNNRQQPQPFPRQRQQNQHQYQRALTPQSLSLAASPRQPQSDIIQHHHNSLNSQNQTLPPTYQEFCQQYPQDVPSTDEEEYTDALTDADDDDDEEVLQRWACNMCTFRNHPQLNICECCENVRIPPEPLISREDIHITLSPGENRIIHSWVVS